MLQKCTALFLLLAFLASTFSKAVIVADFYVHQDYIAKNLCENRDQPMKHCCGRCLLRKRLAREDNPGEEQPRASHRRQPGSAFSSMKPSMSDRTHPLRDPSSL